MYCESENYTCLDVANGNNLEDIKGIIYKKDGVIINNDHRSIIDDVDDLPELINTYSNNIYPGIYNGEIYIWSGLGCPCKCIYCTLKDSCVYKKSPEKVTFEIINFLKKYNNIEFFNFGDYLFTSDNNYVYKLMECFDKYNLNIKWSCIGSVNTINYDLLECIYKHGCTKVEIDGSESVNQEVLDFITEDITVDQIEKSLQYNKDIGIEIIHTLMIGSPKETTKSLNDIISFCKRFNIKDINTEIMIPLPGTELYEYCVKNNLILTYDLNLYDELHQIIKLENDNINIEKMLKINSYMIK
jgi:histone acetyltransferase (RNA polymerase elongator complex component)